MVSWFSQRITVGESEWAAAFERTRIDGHRAYKPALAADSPAVISHAEDPS
jgi:hypothetical protein